MLYLLACANLHELPEDISIVGLGGVISGVVSLTAEAGDAKSVVFEVDGEEVAGRTSGDWSAQWDTRRVDDGLRVVTARARDGRGDERIDTVEVWVSNHGSQPGDVRFVNPGAGEVVCGTVPVEAVAPGAVTLSVDGGDRAAPTDPPFRWLLDTRGLAEGDHTLAASWYTADGARVTVRRDIEVARGAACDPPPVVTITMPGYDAYAPADLELAAGVEDEGGVVRVDFFVDDELLSSDSSVPFTAMWEEAPPGDHRVAAVATDTAGQSSRTEARVRVDTQAPRVEIQSPEAGGPIAGVVDVVVTVEEDVALGSAWLAVDGERVAELYEGENTWSWETADWGWGAHSLEVFAEDRAGQSDEASRTVSVDNPPVVTVRAPGDGPAVDDVIAVEADATDDHALISLALFADGVPLAEGGGAQWDTCAVTPGMYTLRADGVDDAGQVGTDAVRVAVERPPEVAVVNAPTELEATTRVGLWIRADLQVVDVSWTVDGTAIGAATRPREALPGRCALRCAERCEAWGGTLDATSLPEGEHVVTVTVTDAHGGTGSASFSAWLGHDQDGDGVAAAAFGGEDCDDVDPGVFPGAYEECDGVDQDCDGVADDGYDLDADGALDAVLCPVGDDCDDTDPTVNPGAEETCDGIDNDCDGGVDVALPPTWLPFGGVVFRAEYLGAVAANVYRPHETLTLTGVSVYVDPGGAADLVFRVYSSYSYDRGGCSFGLWVPHAVSEPISVTGGPGWYTSPDLAVRLDANDCYAVGIERESVVADYYWNAPPSTSGWSGLMANAGSVYGEPAVEGTYHGYDYPSGSTSFDWADRTFAQSLRVVRSRDWDLDGDGTTAFCGDCDESNAAVSNDAPEVCNGVDDNCDGATDEGFDGDGDGFGSCLECDDSAAAVNPAASETCGDETDDDCDGYAPRCRASTAEVPLADAQSVRVGGEGGDAAGFAVAGGGDLDGDGFPDLLASAPTADAGGSRSGSIYVVRGPVSAGTALLAADTEWRGEQAGDEAGTSLASFVIGADGASGVDLDGDGIDDAVIGAPGDDDGGANAGAVYVVGATGGGLAAASAKRVGLDDLYRLGVSVTVGDLNGDGAADLVAGGADVVVLSYGPVTGHGTMDDWGGVSARGGDDLGAAVAAGDLNGDGVDDLAIGAPSSGTGNGGLFYLVEGPLPARWSPSPVNVDASLGDESGAALAYAGDTDGDGYGDLLEGAPGAARGAGRVYVHWGTSDGRLGLAQGVLQGDHVGDALGSSVAALGDVDGDGHMDLLAGAPGDDLGGAGAGAAWLFYGGSRGVHLLGEAGTVLFGGAVGDAAGTSVAGAGDVDGDGQPDLVVGAPGDDSGAWDAGAIHLFLEIP